MDIRNQIIIMLLFFKKYGHIILSLFLLVAFGFFINNKVMERSCLTSSLIQPNTKTIIDGSTSLTINPEQFGPEQFGPELTAEGLTAEGHSRRIDSIEIPEHVNLTNFYKTYGQRILGNENIKIISREEWGADNRYSDTQFIEDFCKKNYCYEDRYNPEDTFSEKEYWKSLELLINYNQNFKSYDNFFLQSFKKENGFVYYYLPVEEIIVHHTAGKFTTNFEESKKELRKIHLMTAVQRKWRDIGYHYLIDGAGRIYEGSLGGKYSVGIHAYGHNKGTVGISLMGDFRPGHDKLTKAMEEAFINLIEYLIIEYELNINQEEFYLRKPDLSGREMNKNIIKGHMELDIREEPTECPGVDPEYLRELIYPSLKTSALY